MWKGQICLMHPLPPLVLLEEHLFLEVKAACMLPIASFVLKASGGSYSGFLGCRYSVAIMVDTEGSEVHLQEINQPIKVEVSSPARHTCMLLLLWVCTIFLTRFQSHVAHAMASVPLRCSKALSL